MEDPSAPLPPPPATDDAAVPTGDHGRAAGDGRPPARAAFAGGATPVAETLDAPARVLARRTVASGDVVWDGRGADGEPSPTAPTSSA